MIVKIPKPELTELEKANFSIEVAFTSLITEAAKLGLPLTPVTGLMYLSDQAATRQFQAGCRAVLLAAAA